MLRYRFAKKIGVNIKELSKPNFPETVEQLTLAIDIQVMSKDLGTDACTLELIINAFKQKAHEDNIITFCRPVYSVSVQATEQIQEGMSLTGKSLRVRIRSARSGPDNRYLLLIWMVVLCNGWTDMGKSWNKFSS